jgi:hypothetical protein
VRQECPPSLLIFKVYAKELFREVWEELAEGLKVGRQLVTFVIFANDYVMPSQSSKGLQALGDVFQEQFKKYRIKIKSQ